jgi:hypothetical protein
MDRIDMRQREYAANGEIGKPEKAKANPCPHTAVFRLAKERQLWLCVPEYGRAATGSFFVGSGNQPVLPSLQSFRICKARSLSLHYGFFDSAAVTE